MVRLESIRRVREVSLAIDKVEDIASIAKDHPDIFFDTYQHFIDMHNTLKEMKAVIALGTRSKKETSVQASNELKIHREDLLQNVLELKEKLPMIMSSEVFGEKKQEFQDLLLHLSRLNLVGYEPESNTIKENKIIAPNKRTILVNNIPKGSTVTFNASDFGDELSANLFSITRKADDLEICELHESTRVIGNSIRVRKPFKLHLKLEKQGFTFSQPSSHN